MDIDGVLYPMATDYRVGIAYTAELLRGNMTMQRMLDLWFPQRIPPDLEAAQEAIHAFYHCGAENKAEAGSERAPAYDFLTDEAAIIAAFQREYHIDLCTDRLHWWRFSALLSGLLSHSFAERVKYRVADPSSIKSKDIRADYQKYKRVYALGANGEPEEQPETLKDYNEMLLRMARGET